MSIPPDRPIPVRELLGATDAPPADDPAPSPPAPEPLPPPTRILESEGGTWTVEAVSRTRSGQHGDAGAILLELHFTREGEARRVWAVGRRLEDLSDEALEALLPRARPLSLEGGGREGGARVQETRKGVSE